MMSSIHQARLRLAAVALLAASTLLFAIGVAAERSSNPASTSSSSSTPSPEPSGHVEGSGTEGSAHQDSNGSTAEQGPGGLNLEGVPTVAAALLASAAVAGGLWYWWRRLSVLILAALFAAAFGVLDAREVVHQIAGAQPLLVALAVAVMALHTATAAVVIVLIISVSRNTRAAA